jgi:nitrile hydratase beta subunit
MNGPHDLGGQMGFGPIMAEPDEPVFHSDWERRAFALALAMGATRQWNIDISRHARENIPPAQYLSSSYYEIWTEGLVRLLKAHGLATPQEIATGEMKIAPTPVANKLMATDVAAALAKGSPANRQARSGPMFAVGDRVGTRNIHPSGHTRLPRYLRGHRGEIVASHGAHVFPDSSAQGKGDDPQWLYTVRFASREIWGDEGRAGDTICADLWEPYLEPA